jgi:hypothetical protein
MLLQFGQVLRVEIQCVQCKSKKLWASSRVFGGRYLINQKIIHSFTCAGIIPSQYIHICNFADIGTNAKWYIFTLVSEFIKQIIYDVNFCSL